MATLNDTPGGNRVHIAFFGLRNAGKSTLVNAFTGQPLAIVSATPGTTTDPVSKAMEILPLGPCVVTDTAGLDDAGELGEMRVRKTLDVLATTDIAVWVWGGEGSGEIEESGSAERLSFLSECQNRGVVVVEYRRGESVEELKKTISQTKLADDAPGLLDGLVRPGERVVCVCPIDGSAPKGRLILPQVQVIRACLDLRTVCTVCQPPELPLELERSGGALVITDSQAFAEVEAAVKASGKDVRLTSFSILFARQKGDVAEFAKGVDAVRKLKAGDTVLIAEGCTHHRQCDDIGSVKIPKALEKMSGKKLNFVFASGAGFPRPSTFDPRPSLIVHCGGCMLTRREVLRRIGMARDAGVPIVNYGLLLAAAAGIALPSSEKFGILCCNGCKTEG